LYSENYATNVRASGAGLSYQLGGFITGVILALVLPFAIAAGGGIIGSWPYVSAVGVIISAVSIASHLTLKETKGNDLQ